MFPSKSEIKWLWFLDIDPPIDAENDLSSSDTKVYSALGNHDYHPKSQLPPGPNSIYERTAEMWHGWLDPGSKETFKKGEQVIGHMLVKEVNQLMADLITCIFWLFLHRWILHRKVAEP